MYRVRDFIETRSGLIFAVVSNLHPPDGVVSSLRFLRTPGGMVKMESSLEARQLLLRLKPEFSRFVEEFDRELTIVPVEKVVDHYRPDRCLRMMVETRQNGEIAEILTSILSRSDLELSDMGITGSHLIGAQSAKSDIDLVVYGLGNYHRAVDALRVCVDDGIFHLPEKTDWQAIYLKRKLRPADYSLTEFIWHESRKLNRVLFRDRRIDLLSARKCQEIQGSFGGTRYTRMGEATAKGRVEDCSLGWDYPAKYRVTDCMAGDHEVEEVVSFTHTYVDQLREGEEALFRGMLERVDGKRGRHRILVGTSREAPGEYIKVLRT